MSVKKHLDTIKGLGKLWRSHVRKDSNNWTMQRGSVPDRRYANQVKRHEQKSTWDAWGGTEMNGWRRYTEGGDSCKIWGRRSNGKVRLNRTLDEIIGSWASFFWLKWKLLEAFEGKPIESALHYERVTPVFPWRNNLKKKFIEWMCVSLQNSYVEVLTQCICIWR